MSDSARLGAAIFFAAAFGMICASRAAVILDDSTSQALEPSVALRWKSARPSRSGTNNQLVGTATIRVRINVMPWLRRSGRIYLALPAQQPGPIGASWVTEGRLLPGQVQSGNRVLVYAGPVTAPVLEDVLTFQFNVDAGLVRNAFPVTYHFEWDGE
jgi:hypothetical protein